MKCYTGDGILNSAINKLPFEMHIPGYNWCGPGTKVEKRLARNDSGVNGLDEACKEHDIAYSTNKDLSHRHEADKVLASKALRRYKSKDANWKEKIAALGVAGAMKAKLKFGMGLRKPSNRNYKFIVQQCMKKMQKIKQQLEASVRFIDESTQILQINQNADQNIVKKQKTNNRNRKQSKIKIQRKEKLKSNDNTIDIIEDNDDDDLMNNKNQNKRKYKTIKKGKKEEQEEKAELDSGDNNMDVDIANDVDYLTNKIQRKRKVDVLNEIPVKRLYKSKKSELNTNNIQLRLKAKRKVTPDETIVEEDLVDSKRKKLDMNEPIILPNNTGKYNRKRKVNNDDNNSDIPEKIQVIYSPDNI